MRRTAPVLATSVLALGLVGLVGCGDGDGVSLPTTRPSVTAPSVTLPTVTRPTVTRPTDSSRTTTDPTSDTTTSPTSTSTSSPATTDTVTVTTTATAEPSTRTVTRTSVVTRTASASPSTAPAEDTADSGGLSPWAWGLLLLVLAGLAAFGIWWARRATARGAWDERLTGARTEARWVEGSLVDQVTGPETTLEARQTWLVAQSRVMALDSELYALSTSAPDEDRAGAAAQLRQRLTALVDAVGAETSLGPDATVDELRARRGAVTRTRADLRALLDATVEHR